MKIEKGKLYYDTQLECLVKATDTGNRSGQFTDKIAVHCATKEDWEYVKSIGYDLFSVHIGDYYYSLIDRKCIVSEDEKADEYKVISIKEFKKFYPPVEEQKSRLDRLEETSKFIKENNCNLGDGSEIQLVLERKGKKESSNKLNYELDFSFITQMAERMQTNKGKYETYNWKKPIDVEELKQAILRHVIEIMNGNYEDDGRELGHLEAIACNAMMLNYQVKNNK